VQWAILMGINGGANSAAISSDSKNKEPFSIAMDF
jgi:hypothetical protein